MLTAKHKTGLVFFPAFDWAISPTHPEREERLLYTQDQVFEEGLFDIEGIREFKPDLVTIDDVQRVHFCVPDPWAVMTESHFISAGGAKTIGMAVMDRKVDCGFALVRPPGHHAMRVVHGSRGFCAVNIEAIMIEFLRAAYKVRRVAIVDTDCHHGDGTQDIYWHDPDTLFISVHQDGRTLYPGTGFTNELGGPNAMGLTVNIPLPPHTGEEGFLYTLRHAIMPILKEFKPDLIVNSAGQDNHYSDPITNMNFSAQGYAALTDILKPDICVLEGGYSIEGALPYVQRGHHSGPGRRRLQPGARTGLRSGAHPPAGHGDPAHRRDLQGGRGPLGSARTVARPGRGGRADLGSRPYPLLRYRQYPRTPEGKRPGLRGMRRDVEDRFLLGPGPSHPGRACPPARLPRVPGDRVPLVRPGGGGRFRQGLSPGSHQGQVPHQGRRQPQGLNSILPMSTFSRIPTSTDDPCKGNADRIRRLRLRSRVVRAVRRFFEAEGYLEVETPCRIPAPAPELHIDAPPAGDWFLQASPELCMKRLLAAGCRRIFQICRCFRAGERGRRHLPEMTLLEWYAAGRDYRDLMDDCQRLILAVANELGRGQRLVYQGGEVALDPCWERLTVAEAFARYAPISADQALAQGRFDEIMGLEIEPHLGCGRPVFLTDYPASCAALARLRPDDPTVAERFELYIAGIELCNGFSELADPDEQRRRFAAEAEARRRAGKSVYPPAEPFLDDLAHMPPAAGNALGLDRLVMLFADAGAIDEVVAFTPEML